MVVLVGVKFMKKVFCIIELVCVFLLLGLLGRHCVELKNIMGTGKYNGLDIWFGQSDSFEVSSGISLFSCLWLAAVIISIVKLCQSKPNKVLCFVSCALLAICGITLFLGTTSFMIKPASISYDTLDQMYEISLLPPAIIAGVGFIALAALNLYGAISKK